MPYIYNSNKSDSTLLLFISSSIFFDDFFSAFLIYFIYPVFWTEAPAKLVGWFDRVWTFGFAYGTKRMKLLEKALILATTGNTKERLEKSGLLYSMKKVMLGDRLFERVKQSDFVVFDAMSRELESRTANWEKYITQAYNHGKKFFCDMK